MVAAALHRPDRQSGFTMVETMIVVMIIAILAAFAAPAMKDLIRTQRVRAAAYDLLADLTFARSQAITKGHSVTFNSAAASLDWSSGYTVTDIGASPAVVLRTQTAVDSSLAFTADHSGISFDRSGRVSGTVKFNIAPTDSTAPAMEKRCVVLDPSGRARSAEGVCT